MGIVTHLQESTELGSILIVTMRSLLVVALFAVARGNPQFVYTVGQHRYPYVFTNGHSASYSTPSQPLSYVRPQLYANNACRNHLGELVPCALPSVAGQSVYAYNAVPNTGFVQAAAGVAAIPSQVPDEMPPAPEAPAAPVKAKREAEADADASPEANAEADPYYYPGAFGAYHPYYYGGYAYGYPYSKYGLGPLENDLLKPNLKLKLMLILLSTLDTTMLDTMVLTCHITMEPTMPILTTIMLQLAVGIPLVLWFPVLANNVLFSVLQ